MRVSLLCSVGKIFHCVHYLSAGFTCCSVHYYAGLLLMVISMLINGFTWYLCRSNKVNFLRCGHVESDRVFIHMLALVLEIKESVFQKRMLNAQSLFE